MPAYNEEKRIGKTLEAYSSFFNEKLDKRFDYQIFVVINGTKDKTEDVVREHIKKNKRIKFINLKKAGKGYAISQGFYESLKGDFDNMGFVDADMATPPEQYWKLIERINGYDGVIADRYMKGSKITPSFSFRRIAVSRIFNFLVRSFFAIPYGDTQCGAKLFKRNAIEQIISKIGMTQWAYDIDLLYLCKLNGFIIKSVPTEWVEAQGSTLNLNKASIQMIFAIFQLRILKSRFKGALKVISPIVDFTYKLVR